MILRRFQAREFRNLELVEVEPHPFTNLFIGANGQGKTNLLEGIFTLAQTRSFKGVPIAETLRYGKSEGTVAGSVRSGGLEHELAVHIEGNGRRLFQSAKPSPVLRYLRTFHTVAFTARHMDVIRGYPEERRRFLDRGIGGVSGSYLSSLSSFRKAVRQKNRLLKSGAGYSTGRAAEGDESVHAWNQQITELGSEILLARAIYLKRLADRAAEVFRELFGAQQKVDLTLVSGESGEDEGYQADMDRGQFQATLEASLRVMSSREAASGRCLVGPHRNDVLIRLNDRDARRFASSGEQRSLLLALKIAKMEVFKEERSEYPVFLLDDLDSELDAKRSGALMGYLSGRVQVFVTTSKEGFLEPGSEFGTVFSVEKGSVWKR